MKPVLVDTGVIVALLHRTSPRHVDCVAAIANLERPIVTCEAVITESCHLLRRFPGAPDAVMANVEKQMFEIPFQIARSAASVRAIMRKYRDLPASFADACLVQLAGELDIPDILTLDHDFTIYRWGANRRFDLMIDLKA